MTIIIQYHLYQKRRHQSGYGSSPGITVPSSKINRIVLPGMASFAKIWIVNPQPYTTSITKNKSDEAWITCNFNLWITWPAATGGLLGGQLRHAPGADAATNSVGLHVPRQNLRPATMISWLSTATAMNKGVAYSCLANELFLSDAKCVFRIIPCAKHPKKLPTLN